MAKQGSVKLSGRFPPGTEVRLVKVRDERALRSEGGEEVGTAKVDEDGVVEFTSGVEVGARYFICGYEDVGYREVRARGREKGDVAEIIEQPPIGFDRVRLSDGTFLDEPPKQHQTTPEREVGPAPGQHQVAKGVVQRTDTPRGTAHPVDPAEQTPYRRQEDVPDGTVQMTDTDTGRATEIVQSVQRQEEVAAGTLQRSDTPHGVAYPIPPGDAVQTQLDRESAAAKESRGEPGRAATEPLGGVAKLSGAKKAGTGPAGRAVPGAVNPRDVTSGHDAMGQPVYADVAAVEGLAPAEKPLEPKAKRGKATPIDKAPDADTGPDPLERLDDPPQQAEASETEEATTGAGEPKPTGEHSVTKSAPKRRASKSKSTKAKEK